MIVSQGELQDGAMPAPDLFSSPILASRRRLLRRFENNLLQTNSLVASHLRQKPIE